MSPASIQAAATADACDPHIHLHQDQLLVRGGRENLNSVQVLESSGMTRYFSRNDGSSIRSWRRLLDVHEADNIPFATIATFLEDTPAPFLDKTPGVAND